MGVVYLRRRFDKPRNTIDADTAGWRDSRIRLDRATKNGGIASATNRAIHLSKGEFVAFLDNDDELSENALWAYVSQLNEDHDVDVMYSDEDKLNSKGEREEPFRKPDWSPYFFREVMYVGHFLMVRRTLIDQVGGLDEAFDGVQDFELMLRLSEHARKILHVPEILYHWRRIPGSIAENIHAKQDIGERQVAAVNAHLARLGVAGAAVPNPKHAHRAIIQPGLRISHPRVSIIIPTKDAPDYIDRCLNSIFNKTNYQNFEVIVVDNNTTNSAALAALRRHPITVVPYNEKFNYSRANNLGVSSVNG